MEKEEAESKILAQNKGNTTQPRKLVIPVGSLCQYNGKKQDTQKHFQPNSSKQQKPVITVGPPSRCEDKNKAFKSIPRLISQNQVNSSYQLVCQADSWLKTRHLDLPGAVFVKKLSNLSYQSFQVQVSRNWILLYTPLLQINKFHRQYPGQSEKNLTSTVISLTQYFFPSIGVSLDLIPQEREE